MFEKDLEDEDCLIGFICGQYTTKLEVIINKSQKPACFYSRTYFLCIDTVIYKFRRGIIPAYFLVLGLLLLSEKCQASVFC